MGTVLILQSNSKYENPVFPGIKIDRTAKNAVCESIYFKVIMKVYSNFI